MCVPFGLQWSVLSFCACCYCSLLFGVVVSMLLLVRFFRVVGCDSDGVGLCCFVAVLQIL